MTREEQFYAVPITVGDCALVIEGRNIEKAKLNTEQKGIPYIVGASCMKDGEIVCEKYVEDYGKYEVSQLGDIIISTVGTLGKIAINSIGDCVLSKHVCAVRFVPQILPEYGLICLLESLKRFIPPDSDTGTGFSRKLSPDVIAGCPLMLFALDYQRELVDRMVMITRCFFTKHGEDINIDDMPDDPVKLAEWFEEKQKALLSRQKAVLDDIVKILKSGRNDTNE